MKTKSFYKAFLLIPCFFFFSSVCAEEEQRSLLSPAPLEEKKMDFLSTKPLEQKIQETLSRKISAILLIGEDHPERNPSKDIEKMPIQAVGLTLPNNQKMQSLLEPFLGQEVSPVNLLLIKQTILSYYQEENYPLVNVYIPEQEISSGVVKFVVSQTKLGNVDVEGNKYFSSKVIKNAIELRTNDAIEENVLIKNLYFLNKNPFRHVNLVFRPGKEKNTTDINLLVHDVLPYRIYTGFENTGLKLIQDVRWFMGANFGNLWGIDHQFSYQYTTSLDFEKFQAHTGRYVIPFPGLNQQLVIFGGYSSVHAHLDDVLDQAKNRGQSGQASLRYEMDLFLTKRTMHSASLGFDYKEMDNTLEFDENSPIFDGTINLTQLCLDYKMLLEASFYKSSLNVELFVSPGKWLSHQTKADYQVFRFQAENQYLYLRGLLTNLFTLPLDFSISLDLKGQYANKNLLPSEMFGIGGVSSVRGYEERSYNSDSGFIYNFEIRSPSLHWHKSKRKEGLQLLVFSDFGIGVIHEPFVGERKWDYLASIGPGARYAISSHFAVSLDWGIKLRQEYRFGSSHGKLHFQVIAAF